VGEGIMKVRKLTRPPDAKAFRVDGKEELCRPTGFKVLRAGRWLTEYTDGKGRRYYGR